MKEKNIHCCAMSDLHGHLPLITPKCDVMLICGDIVPLEYQNDNIQSIAWFIEEFVPWAEERDCDRVIFIGGNHDFFLRNLACGKNIDDIVRGGRGVMQRMFPGTNLDKHKKLIYLMDEEYEYKGKYFYGTPWIAELKNWAFYKPNDQLREIYNKIPKKCDVLLTHMPPRIGGCGTVLQLSSYNYLNNFGSQQLADVLADRDIKWCLCGHVHSGNHTPTTVENNNYVNVSIKNEDYLVTYNIFEFDI